MLTRRRIIVHNTQCLKFCHDVPTAGHFKVKRTYELVRSQFYWPDMAHYIEKYVKTCDTCQRNARNNQKPKGLLMPLETPLDRWESISMDLGLGFFRFPKQIVSDRDSKWTSKFWTELLKILKVDMALSSAMHPQTDGQTERVNGILESMLRQCTVYKLLSY